MSIHKRQASSGMRYDVRLRDPSGRMYQRTFTTKKEAESYQASEVTDRRRGSWVDPRGAAEPFEAVAREWLASNPAKRSTSLARDETIVRLHLVPALAGVPVGAMTPRQVQALVNEWCRRASARTVRRQYGVLRAILNAAVDADMIPRSPCRGIKLPKPPVKDPYIVNAEELSTLAAAMSEEYRLMPYLAAVLGLRWGECAGLRVGRLDFLRSTIFVAEQRTRGQGGLMLDGPPKSAAGRRTLIVPPLLMEWLSQQLVLRGLTGADRDAHVFAAPGGGALDYSCWRQRVWLPACAAAGLPKLTFHNLRDASATALVAEGVDVKTAQARLGHSDPRLTLAIYAQATTEGDRIAAERLGARFLPQRTGATTRSDGLSRP